MAITDSVGTDGTIEDDSIIGRTDRKPVPMSTVQDVAVKKLRIQIGVVTRLSKEHVYYVNESEKLLSQLAQMKVITTFIH